MPQNPVNTTLFVSKIVAGANVEVTPNYGTGIVTIAVTNADLDAVLASPPEIGGTAPNAITATTLDVTAAATLAGGLSTAGTFTINGVTPVTVANTAVTANSQVLITLKTVGGTVGAIPHVETITPGTGFTVIGTASDSSIYNYAIIG